MFPTRKHRASGTRPGGTNVRGHRDNPHEFYYSDITKVVRHSCGGGSAWRISIAAFGPHTRWDFGGSPAALRG